MQLTDSSAAVVKTHTYEAFGSLVAQSGSVANPYQFQTKHINPATGFSHFGFRSYNPAVGRFITADPLGFVNGPNLYAYVGNNPLNWIDPWGLCKKYIEGEIESFPWWQEVGFWTSVILFPKVAMAGLSAGESTVLYYGPNAWKLAAASSGIPIFKTAIGNVMNWIQTSLGVQFPRIVWDIASAIYAAGARGTVQVFSTLSEYSTDYSSTFYRIEAQVIEFLGKAEMVFK